MPVSPGVVIGSVAVVGLVAGGIAFAMSGDDDDAPSGPRDPYTDPVVPPQTPAEIAALKQVLCTCFRGGATELDILTVCALRQVYDDVPWPAQAGDHPSLASVQNTVRLTAADLLKQPSAAARETWCGSIVDPPPPDGPTPGDDPKGEIKHWGEQLFATSWMPGRLVRVAHGMNGIELAAKATFASAGFNSPSYSKLVKPYMQALSAGKRWNARLYGRPAIHDSNTDERPYASGGVIIKPAWLPRNDDAFAAIMTGRAPKRTIRANGGKGSEGSSYGAVFAPDFDRQLAQQGVLDIVDVDPPAELLELLGM